MNRITAIVTFETGKGWNVLDLYPDLYPEVKDYRAENKHGSYEQTLENEDQGLP